MLNFVSPICKYPSNLQYIFPVHRFFAYCGGDLHGGSENLPGKIIPIVVVSPPEGVFSGGGELPS